MHVLPHDEKSLTNTACLNCGRPLLPAHASFGVCAWCVMESNEKSRGEMKRPGYRFGAKKNG